MVNVRRSLMWSWTLSLIRTEGQQSGLRQVKRERVIITIVSETRDQEFSFGSLEWNHTLSYWWPSLLTCATIKVTRPQVNCMSTKSFSRYTISLNVSRVHRHALAHVFRNVIQSPRGMRWLLISRTATRADRDRHTHQPTHVFTREWWSENQQSSTVKCKEWHRTRNNYKPLKHIYTIQSQWLRW